MMLPSTEAPAPRNLAPDIRASLEAKLARLLSRPLVARIVGTGGVEAEPDGPSDFVALATAAQAGQPRTEAWQEDAEDGTCTVVVVIDYEDTWRDCEKEVREVVANAVEGWVTFLTDAHRTLLARSPREFLALAPPPERAELVSFETETIGGRERVVKLKLAAAAESPAHIRHVAIVPNLVQLERQLEALHLVEKAGDDGPLGPLRALIGACDAFRLRVDVPRADADVALSGERLDEHQRDCIYKAMSTPHFAVIHGPPGSGKTTVVAGIIRRALARGERVLVVSPTHVAVDNVVEKLVPTGDVMDDRLDATTLPVRYAARTHKLSPRASEYWVGAKRQHRGAAIARRLQARLAQMVPFAERLFAIEDTDASGRAPLSTALAGVDAVICGTPIGILSYESVRDAPAGSFGLLIVDEVSKMTLPELLAIAVKARRWVVVGDPAQLPPYNNAEENGTTLDDVLSPVVELACSVGALLDQAKPAARRNERIVVVSSEPTRAAAAIHAHVGVAMAADAPSVGLLGPGDAPRIVVCSREQVTLACDAMGPAQLVRILVERGTDIPRPAAGSGRQIVPVRSRAPAFLFENLFAVYHAQPWAQRSQQRLRFLGARNGMVKYLPSTAALDAASDGHPDTPSANDVNERVLSAIAARFAVNAVSVYDWLTGVPTAGCDVSPFRELAALARPALQDAVRPFVGTLKRQYRMHPSLSRVPRKLFYFEEALFDGRSDEPRGCRVTLRQVDPDDVGGESNALEVDVITRIIADARAAGGDRHQPEIMVITPYREQEGHLRRALSGPDHAAISVCTLDRCQGREADYVFISLVRSRATPFFDMPSRWNVALTRAKKGLFIVGDVRAYLEEAARARRELADRSTRARAGETRPLMSLLARIVEAYERQIREHALLQTPGSGEGGEP